MTMITLPAYPKEIELYTPPPPLPFCDNFQKYSGTIFWGLLPIEIEEKILKMVVNMNQKDIKDEFSFLYRVVHWETDEWKNGYREIVRDFQKKHRISYGDRRFKNNERNLGITKLNRTLSITENSKPFSYDNKCIHEKFLTWKHDMVWGSLLSGDKSEGHSISGGTKLQLSWKCERPIAWRFERGWNDKLNYENSTVEDRRRDRLNMYSNSKLVMSINMNSTLTDLKTYIKDNFHIKLIKHHFGGLSKYKNNNKNELIKKIYSFNEDKYKWVVKK